MIRTHLWGLRTRQRFRGWFGVLRVPGRYLGYELALWVGVLCRAGVRARDQA